MKNYIAVGYLYLKLNIILFLFDELRSVNIPVRCTCDFIYIQLSTTHDQLTPMPSLRSREGMAVSIYETKEIPDLKDVHKDQPLGQGGKTSVAERIAGVVWETGGQDTAEN